MKIFSAFNTHAKEQLLSEYAGLFGEGNVMLISRSKLYYYRHVGFYIFLFFLALSLSAYVVYGGILTDYVLAIESRLPEKFLPYLPWISLGGFSLLWLILGMLLLHKVSKNYIHYAMDFLLVTPKEVIRHDQQGFFAKEVQKLHADKIKSVTVQKVGVLNSFLDIGSITFIAEGDNERGDITMDHVDAIEEQEKHILHILGLDKIA